MKRITITLALAATFIISARGQSFQNLDFESAQNLPGNPGNGTLVSVSNALPDWTVYNGLGVSANIYFVSNTLGNVAGSVELQGGSLALNGNYSAALFSNGSISQTGLVPANAETLQFDADIPDNALLVKLGGQLLSFSVFSRSSNYNVYEAAIPASMDGQTEALTFFLQGSSAGTLLDNIEFSSMGIPEPSEYALLGLGGVLFGLGPFRRGVFQR